MPPIFQELATYASGGTSAPIDIQNVHALSGIQLDITGTNTVGVAAATLTSAGILALLRRIEFNVGGENRIAIGLEGALPGGQLLEMVDRMWYGKLPNVTQPAVGVGANAFNATLVIPFAGSKVLHKHLSDEERKAMSYRRNATKAQLQFFYGADTDQVTPGGGGTAVIAADIRVSMIEDRTLDSVPAIDPESGEDPLNHYHNIVTESIPIAATVAAAEQQRLNLARGMSPGILFYAFDNGAASNTLINTLQILLNGNDQRFNASWDGMVDKTREIMGSQIALPAGFAAAWFDDDLDGDGYLPLGAGEVASTIVQTDHDVSAGGVERFGAVHIYLP